MPLSGYRTRRLRQVLPKLPLSSLAVEAFKNQLALAGESPFLFPSDRNVERISNHS